MVETFDLFGNEISLYYLFWAIGAATVLVLGYLLGRQYNLTAAQSIIYIAGAIILGYLLLWGTSWAFGGGQMNGLNFVRIVIFMPVPVFLLTRLMKGSFCDIADLVAPLLAIYHGVTHIGCMFPGCCHGYPASWGLYSNDAGAVCFPIQPIEAASSILIGVILVVMMRKGLQKGKLYGWYLLLYGATRFIWEFFRDNEKIWHNISGLAFHALAAMLLGALALVILNKSAIKSGKTQNHE